MAATHKQAMQLHRTGQINRAAEIYADILRRDPQNPHALHLMGLVQLQKRQFDTAINLISQAIRLRPGMAVYHHNLAGVLRAVGEFDDAEQHYRLAIRFNPAYAEAYFNLANVRKFSTADALVPSLQEQLNRNDIPQADKCFLHFAVGKILDDLEQYDEAFEHFCRGNAARGVQFDPQAAERTVSSIVKAFPRDLFERRLGEGYASHLPLFVVGMPRSGTTLVEQILSSHPDAFGAGELPDIKAIAEALPRYLPRPGRYPGYVNQVTTAALYGMGKAYVQRICGLAPTALRVVNKMPQDFLFVGLIKLLLPGSRIIHCRRNPLDTCLSCYRHRFRSGHEYSYDLAHLGAYYRQYQRLTDHWHRVLPGQLFELHYEQLTANPLSVSRELVEFCGLDWDDRCLEFHKTRRPVTTASNWQVRRPLYNSSVCRWRNYEKHLGPLRDALRTVR